MYETLRRRPDLGLGWVDGIDHVGELAGNIDIGGGHRSGETQGGEGGVVGVQGGQSGHLIRGGGGILQLGLAQRGGDHAAQNNLKMSRYDAMT